MVSRPAFECWLLVRCGSHQYMFFFFFLEGNLLHPVRNRMTCFYLFFWSPIPHLLYIMMQKKGGTERERRSVYITGVLRSPVWDMYLGFLPSGNQGTEDLCGCCVWKKKRWLEHTLKSGNSVLTWPWGLDIFIGWQLIITTGKFITAIKWLCKPVVPCWWCGKLCSLLPQHSKGIKKLSLHLFYCFKHAFYSGDRNEELPGNAVSKGWVSVTSSPVSTRSLGHWHWRELQQLAKVQLLTGP